MVCRLCKAIGLLSIRRSVVEKLKVLSRNHEKLIKSPFLSFRFLRVCKKLIFINLINFFIVSLFKK